MNRALLPDIEKRKVRILGIAPYSGMKIIMEQLAAQRADIDLTVCNEHFDVNVVFSVVPKALLSNDCDHFFECQSGEVTAAVFDAPVSVRGRRHKEYHLRPCTYASTSGINCSVSPGVIITSRVLWMSHTSRMTDYNCDCQPL